MEIKELGASMGVTEKDVLFLATETAHSIEISTQDVENFMKGGEDMRAEILKKHIVLAVAKFDAFSKKFLNDTQFRDLFSQYIIQGLK